ncbi:MAG: efflux RND transporter permease subunit [Dehalococcoidia bacterium]
MTFLATLLTRLALRGRIVVVLAAIGIVVGGIFTLFGLQTAFLPDIDLPVIIISARYPVDDPEVVLKDVSVPLESTVANLGGLINYQSISTDNLSVVIAQFDFGTDMKATEKTLLANIDKLALPPGVAQPRAQRLNPGMFPIMQLSLLGDREIPDLEKVVYSRVVPELLKIEGVFNVEVTGGGMSQVLVTLNTEELEEHEISPSQVAGVLESHDPLGELEKIERVVVSIAATPDGLSPDDDVILGDLAEISVTTAPNSTITRTNGKPSLGLAVTKKPGGNTVDIANAVIDAVEELNSELGPDLEVVVIVNQAKEIEDSISALSREGLLGALFAVMVMFIFLTSVRPTLVIAVSLPLSILVTFIVLGLLGISLNIVTLGGMTIAAGRVVDDSIVVLENIYRHMRRGESRFEAAVSGTREVSSAIFASTITTIAVFLPLVLVGGIVAAFFTEFALTVTIALLASLLVAVTVVPALATLFIRLRPEHGQRETVLQRLYTPVLRWTLGHRAMTLVLAGLLLVGSFALAPLIPVSFFPSSTEQVLLAKLELPPDTSPMITVEELKRVEAVLGATAGVETYQATVGRGDSPFAQGGGFVGGPNIANIFIGLNSGADPDEVLKSLRQEFDDYSGLGTVTVVAFQGGGPSSGNTVEITVSGEDPEGISQANERIVEELRDVAGLVNVSSDLAAVVPRLIVEVDPERAIAQGFTAQQAEAQSTLLKEIIGGKQVSRVSLSNEEVNVVLQLSPEDRRDQQKVGALLIGNDGSTRLRDIANVQLQAVPLQVSRVNGNRAASITGTITIDDARAVESAVNSQIDGIDLAPGVEVETGGVFALIAEGFRSMFIAVGGAIVLVFIVMVITLRSVRNPLTIILSLPLALVGVFPALLACSGCTLGMPAMMGGLMLVGLVVTNAIVLIVYVGQLRQRGLGIYDALIEGGRTRLRPILMTATTTILVLSPLALGLGGRSGFIGAELAWVVIGGLITSTLLTLVVIPVVYSLLEGRKGHRAVAETA